MVKQRFFFFFFPKSISPVTPPFGVTVSNACLYRCNYGFSSDHVSLNLTEPRLLPGDVHAKSFIITFNNSQESHPLFITAYSVQVHGELVPVPASQGDDRLDRLPVHQIQNRLDGSTTLQARGMICTVFGVEMSL